MSERRKHNDDPPFETLFQQIISLREEVSSLRERVGKLEAKMSMLIQQNQQMTLILKYVVTPLIVILGALIGVKIALPW